MDCVCPYMGAYDPALELLVESYRRSPAPTAMAPPSGHPTLCAPAWPACVRARSSTVRCASLGQEPRLERKMACGRAEPGPLGPSRRRCLGSARFPGSGFPLTPPGHSGLPPSEPHPRPRNVPFHSSLPPQGQAPGGRHSSASLPGSLGGSKAGRTPGFLPPSHPREKFLRGPLRLWVPKITLRGKGGCGEREAGGAQSLAAGCCRCLWKEGARGRGLGGARAPTSPRSTSFVLIPGESLGPPPTPRVGRKPLSGSVSQLVGCTILGQTV